MHKQVAALPIRRGANNEIEVLLITSRETQRWIIPKGWPMKGLSDQEAAAREAKQEAGVIGEVRVEPIGSYEYFKRMASTFEWVHVTVYLLEVTRERRRWRERDARKRAWMAPDEAAALVIEPALATLIENAGRSA